MNLIRGALEAVVKEDVQKIKIPQASFFECISLCVADPRRHLILCVNPRQLSRR